MAAKMEGRSSRKLHSVDQGRSSTLPGSTRFANYKPSANISPPRLVNRWQFRSAKSPTPESNMDESSDGENVPLAATLYQQMQGLVQEMLHSEKGVPIRSHRHKLVSVPSVFTGSDLVHWIMNACGCHKVEAIHVANLLHTHGFLFGVESFDAVIKDDNSLFRFQTPHLWPSQKFDDSDMEYVVYLVKQVKRSKTRVRLEDYEMRNMRKLQKQLQSQWKDINLRADEELRIMKDQKKIARALLESQDRAFWRIRRPPPSLNNISDYLLTKFCMQDTTHLKRSDMRNSEEELSVLQNTAKTQKFRLSTTLDSMVSYCRRYSSLDPMLESPDPTNPWVSNDMTLWKLERSLVDFPTEKQAKKWANSLHDLLMDVTGRYRFEQFCKKEYSVENIRFWQACRDLKSLPIISIPGSVQLIFDEFIDKNARSLVNLSARAMKEAEENLQSPSRYSFSLAQEEIYKLMETDIYPRFLKSPEHAALVKPLENGGSYSKGFFKKLMPRTRSTNPRVAQASATPIPVEIVSPCHPQRFTKRQLSITHRLGSSGDTPSSFDDLFLTVNMMPTDSQSYHEGLDTLTSPGQNRATAAEAHRRISNPEPPSYASLKSPEREALPSVSEDGEEVEELPKTHLVSHTQSLEDLRPRPLSHVFSIPADQLEDHIQPPGVPSLSVVSYEYTELDRNKSCSMENLLYISSPDSAAFERSISASASLPTAGGFSNLEEKEDLRQSAAAFAAETKVTMELPSPEHNVYSSSESVHSSVSVT